MENINFKYHGWERGTGATSSMIKDVCYESFLNLDKNYFLVFNSYQAARLAKQQTKHPIPKNVHFYSIGYKHYGIKGEVFFDGSIDIDDYEDELYFWDNIALRGST